MTTPLSSISGLISGIDYQSLVDQIIAQASLPATQARNQAKTANDQLSAIRTYRGLLETLQAAATRLRNGSAFDAMSATTAIAAGTKTLIGAVAQPSATAASYQVKVTSLAQAQKLGSGTQASSGAPLGLSGTFTVNGQTVTVSASDTLVDLRDRINQLNQGTSASRVSASILTVGTNDYRLLLTSQTAGSAGISLEDTSGSVLQGLGILSAPTTIAAGAVLQAGTDAVFSIDGVNFTRTSNVITDAIEGVTLTLKAAEAGAVTTLGIEHYLEGAKGEMQAFTDAYNKLIDFLKTQGTADTTAGTKPVLYGDNLLRTIRSRLPELLLKDIAGTAADLSRPGLAGLALTKDGKLSFDASVFSGFFPDRLADLRQVFQQTGTVTGTNLHYVTSTTDTKAGTYAVDITQLATQSSVTGGGLSGGVYSDDGIPDIMTVTDTRLGKSVDVTLSDGMTSQDIVDALNTAFGVNGLGLTAVDNGGQVEITQSGYGSKAGITVAYTAGGTQGSDPIAAGSYANGVDVAGTIGGFAATGNGQTLLGSAGSAVAGISVRYDGAAIGAAGDVTINLGTGAELERLLTSFVQSNTGTLAGRETALQERAFRLGERADLIESRLELRRTSLLKQFAAMESALAAFQNQSRAVTALLNSTNSGSGK